ncbi:flagellar biosynthesis protein FlhF [Pullulanibacillus pueri]|uniref:Flagellar biosynthesis protein FlhF n=1 Tax=Pullulanibacillus pueri TaxID=1437324 RepID=A0A8J2ZWU6_9BACL|nr:flagellar biosynthesis protein FlhF [Pullulanibacillus pueri]MBM7682495.1 flagellar biosynthesis protein FlhF [Pullulanibacillus pueri]GGH82170.1 flagellar biosynthesis protein FlhF [Pullulanibacillus pueri]
MKIKKFTADSMSEAMNLVKKELGPNAVILYTKNVKKKGMLSLFKNKKVIEVFAALDQGSDTAPQQVIKADLKEPKATPVMAEHNNQPIHQGPVKAVEWTSPLPEAIREIHAQLEAEGLHSDLVHPLTQTMLRTWYRSPHPLTDAELKEVLKAYIDKQLESIVFNGLRKETKILNLVGPTGVGKTTTAAKIASKVVLDEGKKVGFITTDTYRIAAIEQLKTYAKILSLPVEVVYSRSDFERALTTLEGYDLIIVDTAGRNYQQRQYIDEIQTLIPFNEQAMETYLVLSATAKSEDIQRISNQFDTLPIEGYVFTKLDETSSVSSLLNLVLNNKIGVSYVTNGQDVPDDIVEADKQAFVNQWIEGVWRERSS